MTHIAALLSDPVSHPDARVALWCDGDGVTWGALRARAASLQTGLAGRLRPDSARHGAGPRVGMLLSPGPDWLAALLAIWGSGATAVPLCPDYTERELSLLCQDADVDLVVASAPLCRTLPGVSVVEVAALEAAAGVARVEPAADVAMLLYTSGTTGRPKGVMLPGDAMAHQSRLLAEAWGLDATTRLLHCLPLHHMHGIAIALLPVLAAGGAADMLPRFDADSVWAALARNNTFMAVPTMYQRLLEAFDANPRDSWRAAASALRLTTSGSAALPATLAARWREVAGVIPLERYGMTEIGVGCSNPLAPDARRRGWVGPPLATVALRLSADGDLFVRGPSLFRGYWERDDATRAAFDAEGWFATGDVAEQSDDGFIRLRGRRSVDIIKSGGYKLSALEIEEQLRNLPAVREVAVVGIADPRWGERAVAAVVLGDGVNPEDLRPAAKELLAPYKVPRAFVAVASLPRNAMGKVDKPALVRQLSGTSES